MGILNKAHLQLNIQRNNPCFLMDASGGVIDKMSVQNQETRVEDLNAIKRGLKRSLGLTK